MSDSQPSRRAFLVAKEIPRPASLEGDACYGDRGTDTTTEAAQDSARQQQHDWLGAMAAWASGISMVVYFLCSHGIKNHIRFLIESFRKVIEKTGMSW